MDAPQTTNVGWARLDTDRARRTGDPEVVFGEGKTAEQIVEALLTLRQAHPDRAVLATRVSAEHRAVVRGLLADAGAAGDAVVDDLAGTVMLGSPPAPVGRVAVLTAGSSDMPVAGEACNTLAAFGVGATLITDVGVAGVHRVLGVREEFDTADAVIVVAGMDGALPSVVGGLTGRPVIAVPTSVGYGASFGGVAALLTMLNSCAAGVVVVNIDNGFGAAVHAARIARAKSGAAPGPEASRTAVPEPTNTSAIHEAQP